MITTNPSTNSLGTDEQDIDEPGPRDLGTTASAPAIEDQIVLVTGGARGLGRSLSLAFLRAGAKVVVNFLASRDAADAIVADHPGRAIAVQADVRQREQVEDLFSEAEAHFGAPISTVVNNALIDFSFNGDARLHAHEITVDDLGRQFFGAVGAATTTTQAALAGFDRLGSGRIVNIGTNLFQNPVVPYHDYTAAKAALLSLTRTFAVDLGPRGITVNMISGGLLRTTDASAATPDAVFDAIAEGTPLQRVTTPEEFADTALFFASPWARGVTGQNLIVDGGLVKN